MSENHSNFLKKTRDERIGIRLSSSQKAMIIKDSSTLMFKSVTEYFLWLHSTFGHMMASSVRYLKLAQSEEEWIDVAKKMIFSKEKLKELAHASP